MFIMIYSLGVSILSLILVQINLESTIIQWKAWKPVITLKINNTLSISAAF